MSPGSCAPLSEVSRMRSQATCCALLLACRQFRKTAPALYGETVLSSFKSVTRHLSRVKRFHTEQTATSRMDSTDAPRGPGARELGEAGGGVGEQGEKAEAWSRPVAHL